MKHNRKVKQTLPLIGMLVVLALLLCLWEAAAQAGTIDVLFYSSPSRIWDEFWRMVHAGILHRHLLITLHEAAIGLAYGCVLGTVTGLILGICKPLSRGILPLLVGLNSIPKLALGPLIILWFGIGMVSKALIAGLMVYFIFTFNLYAGYHSVNSDLVRTVRLLGGNRWQVIRQVVWPSCLPWFLTSLRTGLGLSLSGAIVGEYIGASRGFGWLINDASGRYQLTRVLCCVLIMVVLMICLDYLVRLLERCLLRWRPEK